MIDRLSVDLTKNFPEMNGFSLRNLKYMRKFAEEYPDISIVQGPLAQITWYHNIALLEKAKSAQEPNKYFLTKESKQILYSHRKAFILLLTNS